MILTLITLGKYLETRSKGKTSQAITGSWTWPPRPPASSGTGGGGDPRGGGRVGDRIVVRPGQSIPVDGVIVEGTSAVDESALTGESLPVDKGPGDKVAAASINKSGSFTFEALRVGEDTTLAQMIRLVEEASSSKAPSPSWPTRWPESLSPSSWSSPPSPRRPGSSPAAMTSPRPSPPAWPCWSSPAPAPWVLPPRWPSWWAPARSGKRHPHQIRRGPGDPAHGQHCGAGQNGHPHPGQGRWSPTSSPPTIWTRRGCSSWPPVWRAHPSTPWPPPS